MPGLPQDTTRIGLNQGFRRRHNTSDQAKMDSSEHDATPSSEVTPNLSDDTNRPHLLPQSVLHQRENSDTDHNYSLNTVSSAGNGPAQTSASSAEDDFDGTVGAADDTIAHQELLQLLADATDQNRSQSTLANEPQSLRQILTQTIADWLWGGVTANPEQVEPHADDDEHIVNDVNNEAPFVPVARGHHMLRPVNAPGDRAQDPEVAAAAAQAGLDPNEAEAVEDAEDLEGIMELIGMEGPLAGLMQNGMFCAVLVSLTVLFGVWIPYMVGKLFLIVIANPITLSVQTLRIASLSADMFVDVCILVSGCVLYWLDTIINALCAPVGWLLPFIGALTDNKAVAKAAKSYAEAALGRLTSTSAGTGPIFVHSVDVPTFSVMAHQSLRHIEAQTTILLNSLYQAHAGHVASLQHCSTISEGLRVVILALTAFGRATTAHFVKAVTKIVYRAPSSISLDFLTFTLGDSKPTLPLDYSLADWGASDRGIAIACGYTAFALAGVAYLRIAAAIQGTNGRGLVEGTLAQILYQAGGVLKVILIISIEMIAFPLYCGLLLDVALLPLFGDVTFLSRMEFTVKSPWTSVFVHWFVGTCYMFHFALFVSMCRKIMRTGVLCKSIDRATFVSWTLMTLRFHPRS